MGSQVAAMRPGATERTSAHVSQQQAGSDGCLRAEARAQEQESAAALGLILRARCCRACLRHGQGRRHFIAVYDLGGGSCDFSILELPGGAFSAMALRVCDGCCRRRSRWLRISRRRSAGRPPPLVRVCGLFVMEFSEAERCVFDSVSE
eukprot:NODE_3093_length_831_cov_267.458763.p1 GENE.NODE_3093_length_831_cov_267.458763~~NODE_3093_length_831_cov_267.458763.p1  ORF type:complete len:149 (-),score=9.48 NODE_3093_length_831_cov_267.458763:367-813(-)